MPSKTVCCKCFHTTIKYECPKCKHKICSSCKPPERKARVTLTFKSGDRVLAYADNEPGVVLGWSGRYKCWNVLLDSGAKTTVSEDNLVPAPPEAGALIPPDVERCQAEVTKYNAFVMGGPTKTVERCTARPKWIAVEKQPGLDGKRGSMSLCDSCKKVLEKYVTDGKAPPATFTTRVVEARTVTVNGQVVGGFGDVGLKR